MSFFEFPNTRTYDSDLGWLIKSMYQLISEMVDFRELNSIKFADPINWNIATQYPPATIVVDYEGNGYISRKPVPAGVALTSTEYWAQIFNFADVTTAIRNGIAYNAGDSATTQIYLRENDLVWWNGTMYKVVHDMAAGSAFIENVNIKRYTVDHKIKDVISALNTEIQNRQGLQDAIDNEIATRASQVERLTESLQLESERRATADERLNDRINNEADRREQADIRLSDSILNINDALTSERESRIQEDVRVLETALNSVSDLREESQEWHKSYSDIATNTWIDGINGDDETAELYNPDKPFKTLEAAWKAKGLISNDFRFTFTSRGDYYLPARVITGAVVHFTSTVDGVVIYTDNDYGNLFLYDSHLNLRCENTNGRLKLAALKTRSDGGTPVGTPMVIEAEGSTIWTNRGDFECEKLYLIQGSASLTNTTITGWIEAWFAFIRTHNVRVNNRKNNPAIKLITGTLRIENQPLLFGQNTNATSQPAIETNTAMVRIGSTVQQDDPVGSYARMLTANSTVLYCSDAYWTRLTNQAPNESMLNDNALRLRGTATPSVYPPI